MATSAEPMTRMIDTAVDQALNTISGRFEAFHEPDLRGSVTRMVNGLAMRAVMHPNIQIENIASAFARDLVQVFDAISIRTLTSVLVRIEHDNPEPLRNTTGETLQERFRNLVLDDYPELARLRALVVVRCERALFECLSSALKHAPQIAGNDHERQPITSITRAIGPTDRGGRCPLILQWGERRLVYRPTSGAASAFLARVRDLLDPAQEVFGPLVPRVLAESMSTSWYEFVEPATFGTAAEVTLFFERFGAVVALSTALGSGELCLGKMIASVQGPVLTESEMFTRLTGDLCSQSLCVCENAFGRGLVIGGEDLPAESHRDAVLRGYERARTAISARYGMLTHLIRAAAPRKVRVAVRPPHMYSTLLDQSMEPAFLRSGELRRRLFSALGASMLPVPERVDGAFLEAEIDALVDLDVPFFALVDGTPATLGCWNAIGMRPLVPWAGVGEVVTAHLHSFISGADGVEASELLETAGLERKVMRTEYV